MQTSGAQNATKYAMHALIVATSQAPEALLLSRKNARDLGAAVLALAQSLLPFRAHLLSSYRVQHVCTD